MSFVHKNKYVVSGIIGGAGGMAAHKLGGFGVGESVAIGVVLTGVSFLVIDATEEKVTPTKGISLGDIGEVNVSENDLGVEISVFLSKEELPGVTRKAIEKKLKGMPKSERKAAAERMVAAFIAKQATAAA